jgi:hypothetical protein
MPEFTRADAVSGFKGLTVVFARLKETTPARQKNTPRRRIRIAETMRAEPLTSTPATYLESTHIAAAKSAAMTGGGILFSSGGI